MKRTVRTGRTAKAALILLLLLAMIVLPLGCAPSQGQEGQNQPAITGEQPEEPDRLDVSADEPSRKGDAEIVHMRAWRSSGLASDYAERAEAAVNELLAGKGVRAAIRLHLNDADYPTVVASGVESDVFPNGKGNYILHLHDGILADIAPLMQDYPDLYAIAPEAVWRSATIDGALGGVPVPGDMSWNGTMETGVLVRRDILDRLDLPDPETPADLLEICAAARNAGWNYKLAYSIKRPPYALHRTYDEWPFYVDASSVVVYWPDGTVEPYIGSSIYEQDTYWLGQFANEGLMYAINGTDILNQYHYQWKELCALYGISWPASGSPNDGNVELLQLAPMAENFRIEPYNSRMMCISSSVADPRAALSVLQALYTDQAVYDALALGERDVEWALNEDGTATRLKANLEKPFLYYGLHRNAPGEDMMNALLDAPGLQIDFPAPMFTPPSRLDMLEAITSSEGYGIALGLRCNSYGSSEDAPTIDEAYPSLDAAGYAQYVDYCGEAYAEFLSYVR